MFCAVLVHEEEILSSFEDVLAVSDRCQLMSKVRTLGLSASLSMAFDYRLVTILECPLQLVIYLVSALHCEII